jgi:hypothetical protein
VLLALHDFSLAGRSLVLRAVPLLDRMASMAGTRSRLPDLVHRLASQVGVAGLAFLPEPSRPAGAWTGIALI